MKSSPVKSIVFHRSVTLLLQVSTVFSAGLFIFYLLPALDVDAGPSDVNIGISTVYAPVLLAFVVGFCIAIAILCWRGWILFLEPIWRRVNGA
jgi:hypothetical protein